METLWIVPWTNELIITEKVFYGPFFLSHQVVSHNRITYANNVFNRLGWVKVGKFAKE